MQIILRKQYCADYLPCLKLELYFICTTYQCSNFPTQAGAQVLIPWNAVWLYLIGLWSWCKWEYSSTDLVDNSFMQFHTLWLKKTLLPVNSVVDILHIKDHAGLLTPIN